MSRATGIVLIFVGLMILIGIVSFGLWLWGQPVYAAGLSAEAVKVMALLVLADLPLIIVGIILLRRPRISD
jgi:hypothetical protein